MMGTDCTPSQGYTVTTVKVVIGCIICFPDYHWTTGAMWADIRLLKGKQQTLKYYFGGMQI